MSGRPDQGETSSSFGISLRQKILLLHKQYLDEIRNTANSLKEFPSIGHIGKRKGTRELVLRKYPYTIVYRVTSKKVGIVAVVHQARQYP